MSAAEFYNSQGQNQTQTKNEVVSELPAPWIREWDNSYNTWYYVNPTTTPPTIQWNHPGTAPGQAHPEQVAAQQLATGQDQGGAPGERGIGTMAAGAAVGGLTNKMFGGPMGTGGAMLTGSIAAQGASMLGKLISNHKDKKDSDKYKHNMGPPPFQGNQGHGGPRPPQGGPGGYGPPGNYGGGRW